MNMKLFLVFIKQNVCPKISIFKMKKMKKEDTLLKISVRISIS